MKICLLTLLVVLLPIASLLSAAEWWSQFRGPGGDGQADSILLPVEWDETKSVVWKTAIHGRAWSSPVVWADQIWVTSATTDGRQLFAGSQGAVCDQGLEMLLDLDVHRHATLGVNTQAVHRAAPRLCGN